ncbi:hypothetical protein [Sedimenticola hydrogenitrophicus]|uniref:hypothetical protein n=1 Tax=Sedimenticola hydrogenitrophicus TaxID=2967975 RepID=UPI0021A485CF|nr:hypothetical protein [Sedimenticola hydrogenitrophicus]
MRVVLYFVAFGFLFAFVIPMLVGSFIDEDDQVARQLRQGADPTAIMGGTASGTAGDSCTAEGYHYLMTGDGYPYVQQQNSPYIAALINNDIVIMMVHESDNLAIPVLASGPLPEAVEGLSAVLKRCVQSDTKPRVTPLSLQNRE